MKTGDLDEAARQARGYLAWRTERRISYRLLLEAGKGYVRTHIGSLPVFLGENRMWVPVHSWLLSRPRALCTPKKKRVRREIDARLAVPPGLISVKEVDHDTQTVGPVFRV